MWSSHYNPIWRHVALAISPDLVRAATTRQTTQGRILEEKQSEPREQAVSDRLTRSWADCGVVDPGRGIKEDHAVLCIKLRDEIRA
jgi:hypothetical protein